MRIVVLAVAMMVLIGAKATAAQEATDPYLSLMKKAAAHAKSHRDKYVPALSPDDSLLLGAKPQINVKTLHAAGFKVVPWTTNDPEKMKALIALGVDDGIISDRPDILQKVVAEERAAGHKLIGFDVEAHRGGRGLRAGEYASFV